MKTGVPVRMATHLMTPQIGTGFKKDGKMEPGQLKLDLSSSHILNEMIWPDLKIHSAAVCRYDSTDTRSGSALLS